MCVLGPQALTVVLTFVSFLFSVKVLGISDRNHPGSHRLSERNVRDLACGCGVLTIVIRENGRTSSIPIDIFKHIASNYLDIPDLAPLYFTSTNLYHMTHELLTKWSKCNNHHICFPVQSPHYWLFREEGDNLRREYATDLNAPRLPVHSQDQITWWAAQIRQPRMRDMLASVSAGDAHLVRYMFRTLGGPVDRSMEWLAEAAEIAAKNGRTSCLPKLSPQPGLQHGMLAARKGHLDTLQWLHQESCIADSNLHLCTHPAARGGKMHILQWLRDNQAVDSRVYVGAAGGNHIDVMNWAVRRDDLIHE